MFESRVLKVSLTNHIFNCENFSHLPQIIKIKCSKGGFKWKCSAEENVRLEGLQDSRIEELCR